MIQWLVHWWHLQRSGVSVPGVSCTFRDLVLGTLRAVPLVLDFEARLVSVDDLGVIPARVFGFNRVITLTCYECANQSIHPIGVDKLLWYWQFVEGIVILVNRCLTFSQTKCFTIGFCMVPIKPITSST